MGDYGDGEVGDERIEDEAGDEGLRDETGDAGDEAGT